VTEIGRSIGGADRRPWYRHAGSTLAMALGAIYFLLNLVPPGPGMTEGPAIVLAALACRSAKKRQLGEAADGMLRQFGEALLLVPTIAGVAFQRDLGKALATAPIPTLVLPGWCLLAYAVAALRAWWRPPR
jgi:hypothetical protein